MPPKRSRAADPPTNTTTIISDLPTSHTFLAPNEYSLATIGIHSCLLRYYEHEHFAKSFYQGITIGVRPKYFIDRLNDMEKKLKDDCYSHIERCAMIARLRRYLEKNDESFPTILTQIENHLHECMREDTSISFPQTYDEFMQQCFERNEAALVHDRAHRMRRFQFHDHDDVNKPINLINLQNWVIIHFQFIFNYITMYSPVHPQLIPNLETLLINLFFIVQHPSPPIATVSPAKKENVTASLYCKILCLLDRSCAEIIINDITPYVCCLSNPMEEPGVSYQQSPMSWKTYSIITASGNQRNFSCAELSEIVLNETSAISQNQKSRTGRMRFTPFVYRIDFHIDVTVNLPNGLLPYRQCVIVQSSPFGLICNTAQLAALRAQLFIQDLNSWKQISAPLPPLTTILNDIISSVTTTSDNGISSSKTTNLTMEDIVTSVRRYFIYKTGIQPKHWVMPYIENVLTAAYNIDQNSMGTNFYDILAKILAQISYMAEHPLLILFHADGFFFGVYDSTDVSRMLLKVRERFQRAVCAIRFGSIYNMSDAGDVGVRIDLIKQSSTNFRRYKFDTDKLSYELGLFIVKIVLSKASHLEDIVSDITKSAKEQQYQATLKIWSNLSAFMIVILKKLCDKLRKLCPHEEGYPSIWTSFESKENNKSKESTPSPTASLTQTCTNTTTIETTGGIDPYNSYSSNMYTVNQAQHMMETSQMQHVQRPQFPQPLAQPSQYCSRPPGPLHPVSSYASFSNVSQSLMVTSPAPIINQSSNHPAPGVIVITVPNQYTISDQHIAQWIINKVPEYSSFIQSAHILRLDYSQQSTASDPLSLSTSSKQNQNH